MDAIIKIQFPNAVWTLKMATAGDGIIARISIYIQIPNGGTISIVIDWYWSSVSAWELDAKTILEPLVNDKNAIVESRVKAPRYDATATERRAREIIYRILGIPGL